MKVELIFSICLMYVYCGKNETELKIDYYEALIKSAINRAHKYKVRKDNTDFFKETSDSMSGSNHEFNSLDYGTFDFIVVGAGSSGSVVASRLSEIKNFKILLLEAGDWDDDLSEIPYTQDLFTLSDKNWGYFTTPQINGCYGSEGNRCVYYQEKIVGGSGSNALAYTRGNRADYDNWESLGNPGWSFNDVLRYFKKLENFKADPIDSKYRGFAGPVDVTYISLEQNFTAVSGAYSEIGVAFTEDYNAEKQQGVSLVQRSIAFGRRVSGATAYVKPSNKRYNLNVTVRALATKILISQSNRTAYAVKFIKNGKFYIAKARKEIILSAGAFNSPQLLLLSGIGPEDDLMKQNVPVIVNSPVGKHLKEHYSFEVHFKTNTTAKKISLREGIRQYLNGEGILTNLGNSISFSYHNTRNASSSSSNIELVFYLPSPLCLSVPSLSNSTEKVQEYKRKLDICNNVHIDLSTLHPKSYGTLKLQSSNPMDFPLIDMGIFTNPEDLEEFYEGIQIINKLSETSFAKENGWKLISFEFCKDLVTGSKDYWICALKHLASPGFHPSSTAKMGPVSDPLAVVDHRLRVYGINRLRVADCSIMPTHISGHNNAAAFLIGEKAADLIKQDHLISN